MEPMQPTDLVDEAEGVPKEEDPVRSLSPSSPARESAEEDQKTNRAPQTPHPPSPVTPVARRSVTHTAVQTQRQWVSGRRLRHLLQRRRTFIMTGTNGHANGHSKTFTEGIAARVLEICRGQDGDSRITYVGRDEDGRTVVRVRGGISSSVVSLQRVLGKLMPFARVRTSEDVLDGSVQTQIVIPTSADEWTLAYQDARGRLASRFLGAAWFMITVFGLGVWAAGIISAEPRDI